LDCLARNLEKFGKTKASKLGLSNQKLGNIRKIKGFETWTV